MLSRQSSDAQEPADYCSIWAACDRLIVLALAPVGLGEAVEGVRVKDNPANASLVCEGNYALLALFLVEALTFRACRFKLEVIGFRLCAL